MHGDLLAGAAMAHPVTSSLGNQRERVFLPVDESFRSELVGSLPQVRLVVGAVDVEQHHRPSFKWISVPFERSFDERTNKRGEGVEAPNLLHEQVSIGACAAGYGFARD